MTRSPRLLALALVAVTALALASCSSDDGAGGERLPLDRATTSTTAGSDGDTLDPGRYTTPGTVSVPEVTAEGEAGYVEALALNLRADPDNEPLLGEAAGCVAPAWVRSIGADRFDAAGITPQDLAAQRSMNQVMALGLSLDESRALVDALDGCDVDLLARALETPAFAGAPAETRSCIEGGLTEAMLLDTMTASLTGATEAPEVVALRKPMEDLVRGCAPDVGG